MRIKRRESPSPPTRAQLVTWRARDLTLSQGVSQTVPAMAPALDRQQYRADFAYFTQSTFFPITFAGLPATRLRAGTFFVTTLPAPTTAPEPIVTPDNTKAPAPIQTLSPITTGIGVGRGSPSMLRLCPFPSRMLVFHEMAQSLPMEMCSKQVTVELQLMYV